MFFNSPLRGLTRKISNNEKAVVHKVFTTPMSNRTRAILLVGESIGFDARHISAGQEFHSIAQNYDRLKEALRNRQQVGVLYDNDVDRQITKILFPSIERITQVAHSNLIAGLQSEQHSYSISERERTKTLEGWSKTIESEIRSLRNSHLFYNNGSDLILNDSLYVNLVDQDRLDVLMRVDTLHQGFTALVGQMLQHGNFMQQERLFLNRVSEEGAGRIPIKQVQTLFSQTTTLSLLRYFVTRLWIIEHFSDYNEE